MNLSILRGDIQKLVAVNACSKPLSVDLALGLIGAYMLRTSGNSISEWKEMNTFLTFLHRVCFRGRNRLIITESPFIDCVLFIQKYLSTLPYDQKKESLLSLGLKVITGVEENGYLSFNNTTFGVYSRQEKINGFPANKFIVDSTSDSEVVGANIDIPQDEPIQEQPINEATDDNNVTQVIHTIEEVNEVSDAVKVLVAEKKSRIQNACKDDSPFVQLYEDLINKDRENRTKAEYTWQWLLSLDEYNAIKECIGENKIPSPKNWDSKTARLLALYIGEYYKREYESNINPFAQFGDDSPNVKFKDFESICSFLNIEPYKKVNDAHKFTICVNGGLPVHYISTKLDKNKTNSLIDGLSKLLDPEDDNDRMEGEDLLEKGSNTATRESYHNHHSIYEYIHALKEDEKTWNDSDNDNKEFCEFKGKVIKAKKKAQERKKFKIFYSLWTFWDNSNIKEFYITPQLRFNPEEEGERHYAISKQRLESWGIKNPPAQFSLQIGDTSIIFTICYNGDYISTGMIDRIDLSILDMNLKVEDLSDPDYTIIYDDLTDEPYPLKKDFYLPFKEGYMQLYTDDDPSMASWNSYKGAQAFRWSGVFYDKNRYQLLSQTANIDINEQIGWVTFADSVTLEDTYKGKIRTFFNSKGSIYAKPSNNSLHTTIIDSPCLVEGCILDGQAECAIGDEQGKAYIIKSNGITFDVFRAADDEKVDFSTVVVYKSASNYRDSSAPWQEYDSKKTKLDQGLYVFRLSRDRYMTEVKCYVLPEKANISFYNDSKPNKIEFNDITNVSSDGIKPSQKNNSIVFKISDNKDFYYFTLGDNYGNISLKTYHPRPQIHVYLHGREITEKSVIMAFADDTEIKYISAKSCKNVRLSEKSDAYKRLFNALTATALGNSSQLLTQAHSIKLDEGDEKSKLMIRVYTQEISQNKIGSVKMMLLDLDNNDLRQISSIPTKVDNDSLLIQSLKDVRNTDVYFAPKFVSHSGIGAASNVKKEARQKKLAEYADKNHPRSFVSACAYQQFEIACEHKIYFAVFDPLLGMCWDVKNKTFLDVTKTNFKKNLLCFLQGYIDYTNINSHEPNIAGLKRLAREFLFDWRIIKKDIDKSDSDKLKELYQEIINN